MFSPNVKYTYVVAGRSMEGCAISLVSVRSSNPAATRKWLALHPCGTAVKVFFDIERPDQCYLTNPKKHVATTLAAVAGFVLFGVLMNLMICYVVK